MVDRWKVLIIMWNTSKKFLSWTIGIIASRVIVCDWIRATHDARSPNIVRDQYGFTLANFNHMDGRVYADSFAFPLHCEQVFFSDDPH